jgi:hypothetical protein
VFLWGIQERNLNSGSGLQGVNFLEDCVQALLQLLLCPWFTLGLGKLAIVGQRTAVEISSLIEQVGFGIILCRHSLIIPAYWALRMKTLLADMCIFGTIHADLPLKKGLTFKSLEPGLRQLLQFIHAIVIQDGQIEAGLALHETFQGR